jgi:hypothetical protein
LLQLAARLDTWASAQPGGFRGSREWGALAGRLPPPCGGIQHRAAQPGQPARSEQARRLNDAELVSAVANVERHMDAFRTAYDGALTANTSLTPASRQTAIQNVDAMKTSARALQPRSRKSRRASRRRTHC